MLNLEIKTKLTGEKVLGTLKNHFGKGGVGLALTDEGPQCLTFEGGGGYVTATFCPEEGGTRINFVTQEWDFEVKKFAAGLH